MADLTFKTRTYQIVVHEGHGHLKRTVNTGTGEAVYPGMVVTATGHTWPEVGKPDAIYEVPLGIIGLPDDQDIDTAFSDDEEVIAYMVGSGAIMFTKVVGDKGVTVGEKMYCAGAGDTGWVTPAHTIVGEATASFGLELTREYVGIVMETLASAASVKPLKIALV